MSEPLPNIETEVPAASNPIQSKKRKLTKTLCTSRIPFKKQLEIISAIPIAFDKHAGPINFKEVGEILSLSEATLLQISAFLNDVGLIRKGDGGRFTPAADLLEYGRIRGFSADKAWLKLGPMFERSWFGQELMPRLRLKEMSEIDAIHCLAEASYADKDHQEQLEMSIMYLERVGLVVRDAGNLRLGSNLGESSTAKEAIVMPPPPAIAAAPAEPKDIEIEGLEKHSLTLDPKAGRKVVIFAPPTLKAKELERLQQWLGFQFIIDQEVPA